MKSTRQKRKQLRLTKRDLRILAHVRTFQMTWFDVLHQLYFPGKHPDAVKSTLRRLCGKGYCQRMLYSHWMDARRSCYQLTLAGTRILDAPPDLSRSLGKTALARRYALQWFLCLEGSAKRVWISNQDLTAKFATIDRRLPQANFYKAKGADSVVRLGYVIIDYGSDERRAVGRLLKRANEFVTSGWFDGLVASQTLEFTVLTLSETKVASIQRRLRSHDALMDGSEGSEASGEFRLRTQTSAVLVRFVVVDGFADLIPDAKGVNQP